MNASVKCTRCRHMHLESDRLSKPRPRRSASEIEVADRVCPKCNAKPYYDCTPQVAWCWASGLIEIGDQAPADNEDGSGAIKIATGPKYALKGCIEVLARHGRGDSEGKLLVPGVPEAEDQRSGTEALADWLEWCSGNRRARRDGIQFMTMGDS